MTQADRSYARSPWRGMFHEVARHPLQLQPEAVLLLLLSVGDLVMTYILLSIGSHYYEANPIANWWYSRWNMAGMTAFKFLLIGGVIAISELVERRRRGYGKLVLWVGCFGALVVIGEGLGLYLDAIGWAI